MFNVDLLSFIAIGFHEFFECFWRRGVIPNSSTVVFTNFQTTGYRIDLFGFLGKQTIHLFDFRINNFHRFIFVI